MQTKDGKPFTATTPFIQLVATERQANTAMRLSASVIIAIISFLYLLPFAIAFGRKRTNTGAIFIVNFFLGWTMIGWLAALIWSVMADDRKVVQ